MMSIIEIRCLVSKYLVRSIDLSAFADEFAGLFYDIEDDGDQEAISLSYRIESELAKFADGLFDERVLRNSLIQCLQVNTYQNPVFSSVVLPVEVAPSPSGNALDSAYHATEPIYALV